jgi:hypothetical protein
VRDILLQRRAADMVFDYVGRKNHAVPSLSRELAKDKIFGQVILQPREASNRLQDSASGGDGRADCEVHTLQHPRD